MDKTIIMPRDVALMAVKRWFTADEAAMYLDVSVDKVKKLCQSRELASSRRGTHLYIKLADIEDWLESCRIASVDEIDALACTYTAAASYAKNYKK